MADEKPKKTKKQAEAEVEETTVEEPVAAPEAPVGPTAEVEATPAEEPEADQVTEGEPVAETTAEEEAAAEEVVEQAPAEEPEPVDAVPEPAVEEPEPTEAEAVEEPVAEAETTVAEPAAEEEAPAAEAVAAPPTGPKPKRKRLPRTLRRQRPKRKREPAKERKPIVRLEKPEHERGRRQERQGIVVGSTNDKTIVVRVDTVKAHRKYKKVVRRSTKFHAHDEANAAKVGDVVRIVETRPISKLKRWRLAEVVEEAK